MIVMLIFLNKCLLSTKIKKNIEIKMYRNKTNISLNVFIKTPIFVNIFCFFCEKSNKMDICDASLFPFAIG